MPNKEWVEKNKDHLKEYQAKYYLKNITRLKKYKRNWYQEIKKVSNDKS